MTVLVDTCVWSLVLRRHNQQNSAIVTQLNHLIQQRQVVMLGVIRQEILSGIQHHEQFERIRHNLRAFSDYPVTTTDYETAAQFYNQCRAKGVQGSNTDFLLCAVAYCHDLTVFTVDRDFEHFAKHINFKLDFVNI